MFCLPCRASIGGLKSSINPLIIEKSSDIFRFDESEQGGFPIINFIGFDAHSLALLYSLPSIVSSFIPSPKTQLLNVFAKIICEVCLLDGYCFFATAIL